MQNDLISRVNRISRHPLLEKMTEERRSHFMGDLSEDCIHGICTGVQCNNCGCCSRNSDVKDRLLKLLNHYKRELKYTNAKDCSHEYADIEKFQHENKMAYIRYCKKQIRACELLLKELEKVV